MSMWPTATARPAALQPTREYRAIVTFWATAGLVIVALLLGRASQGAVFGALLGLVASIVEARGISQRRDWARYAMTPMLWIYVGASVLMVLVALSHSGVNIPIGGILAAWALSARPSQSLGPVPAHSLEGTLLILASIVAAVIQFL
jgi:hypothetical protein